MGNKWIYGTVYGHDGNDTIYLPSNSFKTAVYGGKGDDQVIGVPFDEFVYGYGSTIHGGEGNDFL